MNVKPLKDLLKQADEFSRGLNKAASSQAAAPDEISKLAQTLIDAESVEQVDSADFEKAALALNRAEALNQVETMQKMAAFQERALKEGHSQEQVNEAMDKIAAKKLKESLAKLTAIGQAEMPGQDKNSLAKKEVPARDLGQPHTKDVTQSLGYGK